jgi:FtsH-binding integral membrane protein
METNNFNGFNYVQSEQDSAAMSKTFMANVFSWMFAALVITGIISYTFGTNMELLSLLVTQTGFSGLGYVVLFAPLAFILVINFGFEKLSLMAIVALFALYSIAMGVSLSFIFVAYAHSFIYQTFFISAGTFGLMALLGYTTKTDLTKLGSILMIALFGVIIASVVMMFTGGDTFIIDILCVFIFTGLTAYKVQMLKEMGAQASVDTVHGKKLAVWGALSLYITFINLFLTLLRLFGRKD